MKILLVQNMVYVPTLGGANKGNRILLEELAGRGHECHVVAPALGLKASITNRQQFHEALASRNLSWTARNGVDVFHQQGVEVHAVTDSTQLRRHVIAHIKEFDPDWVLVTSEDPEQQMLQPALEAAPTRVVYVVHTPLMLPFGPDCFLPNPESTEQFRRCAGVITYTRYTQEYIRKWSGVESVLIPFPVFGRGPFADFGCFDKGYVTLVNPCAYKGLPIFLELVRRFPEVQFAVVSTWGTTQRDRAALAAYENVVTLQPAADIDVIFAQTRILLMPSLWIENAGFLCTEAMLRGIPVIASNSGALPETKMGVDYVLPVRTIERYHEELDELGNPLPVIPPQDIGPWEEALRRLVTEREHYDDLSRASREAAHAFVAGIGAERYEEYLNNLQPAQHDFDAARSDIRTEAQRALLSQLSPERLELLARRVKKRESSA